MQDSLKALGTSTGTLVVNIWHLVPEALGVVLDDLFKILISLFAVYCEY